MKPKKSIPVIEIILMRSFDPGKSSLNIGAMSIHVAARRLSG
jgi:hypothetical protein